MCSIFDTCRLLKYIKVTTYKYNVGVRLDECMNGSSYRVMNDEGTVETKVCSDYWWLTALKIYKG